MFKCMAGLEDFDGEITSDIMPLKNHLGLLTTEPYFFPKITGGEYISLLSYARGHHVNDIDAKNIFKLPLNKYAINYSTGMKKKLVLTGILLQNNQYFILDEPFNGVDIQGNILITEIILHLKSLGKIILLFSHIFSTLKDTCDEIFLLHNGELVKHVLSHEFDALEDDMKNRFIGQEISKLGLK